MTVAIGERVAVAIDGVALRSGVGVAKTLDGAVQDTSIVAKSKRSIVRR